MLTYICIYVYNLTVKCHKYTKLVLFNNNTSFRYLCTRDVGSFVIFILFYDKLYIVPTCCIVDSYAVEFFIKFEYTMRRYKFVSINHSMHSTHRSFIHHALFLTTLFKRFYSYCSFS